MPALLLSLVLTTWPLAPDAGLPDYARPENWPNDPAWAGQWPYFSFSPSPLTTEPSGAGVDRAWSTTRGSAAVTLAVVSPTAPLGSRTLRARWRINPGEVKPADGGFDGGLDLNGDGRVDTRDFELDPRVADVNGNGFIDADDLNRAFADGVDDDLNGYPDDVCGWDFIRRAPIALATDAGEAPFSLLAEPVNDGEGGAGVCPDCSLLPLVSDALPAHLAEAIDYAAAAGATALVSPPVLGASTGLRATLAKEGLLVVAGTDRRSWALDWPAADPRVLGVTMVGPAGDPAMATGFSLTGRCSGRGTQYGVLAPSAGCGESAAALVAGGAGLLRSLGPATAAQLRQALSDPQRRLDLAVALGAAGPVLRFEAPAAWAELPAGAPFEVAVGAEGLPAGATLELFAAPGFDPQAWAPVPLDGGRGLVPLGPLLNPSALADDPNAQLLTLELLARDGPRVLARSRRAVFVPEEVARAPDRSVRFGAGLTPPHLIDVDRDGDDELIFGDLDGRLHLLDSADRERPGFPVQLSGPVVAAPALVTVTPGNPPTIFAITADGALEGIEVTGARRAGFPVRLGPALRLAPMIAPSRAGPLIFVADPRGLLHVVRADGTVWARSPLAVRATPSAIATEDLDRNGWPEVVVVGGGEATVISVEPDNLSVAPGWPIVTPSSQVALGDLDGDGTTEVVLDAVYDPGGISRLSFSPMTAMAAATVIADLDDDGLEDVLITEPTGDGSRVHLFSAGNGLVRRDAVAFDRPGWPRPLPDLPVEQGPLIADVDGDGLPEVISAQQAFSVFAFAASSAPARDFPRSVAGTAVGLAIGWGNRALQLVATTSDGQVRRWSVLGLPGTFRWEAVGHDARHTQCADAPLPVREVPGLGVKDPVHRPPSPCGCGAPPGLGSLLGLLAWLRRVSPRRREIC